MCSPAKIDNVLLLSGERISQSKDHAIGGYADIAAGDRIASGYGFSDTVAIYFSAIDPGKSAVYQLSATPRMDPRGGLKSF